MKLFFFNFVQMITGRELMQPKTFDLVECNKYEFSFMAAIYCYFMVQKSYLSTKAK